MISRAHCRAQLSTKVGNMEDEFSKEEFHSTITEKVAAMNDLFSEVISSFKESCDFIEDKEDIEFMGGGVHGIMGLLQEYNHKLHTVDQMFQKRFGELQVKEDKLKRFEKSVLQSLDNLTITDAYDER
jgi:hypothetical protein